VQQCHHENADRPGQVQQAHRPTVPQHALHVPQVGVHDIRTIIAGQNRPTVRNGDGIHIDVDHPSFRIGRLRHLVHIADRRNTRPDVEKLTDTLTRQVTHRPPHKRPIGLHDPWQLGPQRNGLPSHFPISRKIV
jgi:hypothetical protein